MNKKSRLFSGKILKIDSDGKNLTCKEGISWDHFCHCWTLSFLPLLIDVSVEQCMNYHCWLQGFPPFLNYGSVKHARGSNLQKNGAPEREKYGFRYLRGLKNWPKTHKIETKLGKNKNVSNKKEIETFYLRWGPQKTPTDGGLQRYDFLRYSRWRRKSAWKKSNWFSKSDHTLFSIHVFRRIWIPVILCFLFTRYVSVFFPRILSIVLMLIPTAIWIEPVSRI